MNGTESVLVCPFTSRLRDAVVFRFLVQPDPETGLRETSQLMVDKIAAIRRDKCGKTIGKLGAEWMTKLDERLALIIGLADDPP